MLILSRRKEESVTITDGETNEVVVVITITDLQKSSVRLGLQAKQRYKIARTELLERQNEPTSD